MSGYTDNPIDHDDRLVSLVSDISNIKSEKAYHTWRKEFLRIYTKHLDKNGILNGKDANYRLLKQLQKLDQRIEKFRPVLEDDSHSIHSTNGRRLLTNLTNEVVKTETKVQELLPKTSADEERFGFDKFELAAVLLEDGFQGYDAMNASRYILESIAPHIQGHDAHHQYSNEVAILHQYSDAVESFVKVMQDLKVINIMNHCVDVVYKGAQRPDPKPPPPPEEAEEDSSICSDSDGELEHNYSSNKIPKKIGSKYDQYEREAAPAESPTKPTKKKKKAPASKSSTKESAAVEPSKKTKKKPKKKGSKGAIAGDNDDDDSIHQEMEQHEANDNPRGLSSSSYKPKSPRKKPKGSPSKSNRRDRDDQEDDDDSSGNSDSSESEEEEEEEDEDQDQGGPPEFLLYFDPKTNSIGKIPFDVAAKSSLIIDQEKQESAQGAYSSECYKNVMESQDEKQDLIFLLKKLERNKPQEESWLDKIKREKEEAKAKNNKKKFHKSTANISRRNLNANSNSTSTKFQSPLGGSSKKGIASKGKPLANKSKYKQVAEKPDSSGWSKPTSSRGLLQ